MATAKVNTHWFQSQLESRDISQRRLAKTLHIDPGAVSKMLKGERQMKLEEATTISKLLAVPLEEVLSNAGIATVGVSTKEHLKVVGWVDPSFKVVMEAPRGPKTAPRPIWGGRDLKCVRFQTEGSALAGMDGALAYFQSGGVLDAEAIGRLCILELAVEGHVCGIPKRGYRSGHFNVSAMNGSTLFEGAKIVSASPILWLKL